MRRTQPITYRLSQYMEQTTKNQYLWNLHLCAYTLQESQNVSSLQLGELYISSRRMREQWRLVHRNMRVMKNLYGVSCQQAR